MNVGVAVGEDSLILIAERERFQAQPFSQLSLTTLLVVSLSLSGFLGVTSEAESHRRRGRLSLPDRELSGRPRRDRGLSASQR